MSAPKNLREAAADMVLASDDGTEYEHNDGCQGEADCPACWVEGIRRLFADFPSEAAPVASRERVAGVLHDSTHGRLACTGSRCYIWDEAWKSTDALLAAGIFRDEATVKAEARQLAAKSIRDEAVDEAIDGGLALTAVIRICEETGR